MVAALGACSSDAAAPVVGADLGQGVDVDPAAPDAKVALDPDIALADAGVDAPAVAPPALEVTFLGVGGFLLRVGNDAVMTAPMYTNPSFTQVLFGSVTSDRTVVDAQLPDSAVRDVSAIISGHAHYDHLLDVPHVLAKTTSAHVYGNMTMKRLLAGLTPDRPASCPNPSASWPAIARDRLVALDDPQNDRVDYRSCGGQTNKCTGGGGGSGAWVAVPGSHVRIRALCSMHPAQFLAVHFGEGCTDDVQCEPPAHAGDWKEGQTLAFLVDFLDAAGKPMYRIYYQDAPTDPPIGHVPASILAEKRVDLALLCVGNTDQVKDHPAAILKNLDPRYTIGGHWEDFFRAPTEPPQPIAFHDIPAYDAHAGAALGSWAQKPALVNGKADTTRHWVPDPGTRFRFDAE